MIDIGRYTQDKELFDGRYKILESLSMEGGTADVWLALDMDTINAEIDEEEGVLRMASEDTALKVAIKIYRQKNIIDFAGEQLFKDEFKRVYECRHANLLTPTYFSIFEISKDEKIPYLVLPYCANGSSELLTGQLKNKKDLWKYIHDVASGLAYLHALDPPIIHQDVKPANVLIDDNGNYAITDFGISTQKGKNVYGEKSGTWAYMAPERFVWKAEPRKESDIWSLGATIYEMVSERVPFGDKGGRTQTNSHAKPNFKGLKMPRDIKKLIEACLDENPDKRPTAEAISTLAAQKLKGGNWIMKVAIIAATALVLAGAAWWAMNNVHVEVKGKKVTLQKDSKMDDAVTYSGSMLLKGVPDGKGKAIYSDGSIYEGNFVKGKRDGDHVRYVDRNMGEFYDCTFSNDIIKKGKFRSINDGHEYEGPFQENGSLVTGVDVIFRNGFYEFFGQLEYNIETGYFPLDGTMKILKDFNGCKEGDCFVGKLKDGEFYEGTYSFRDGGSKKYVGGKVL